MERNFLQVNFPNIVSITLMAAVGVLLIGGITSAVNSFRGVADE